MRARAILLVLCTGLGATARAEDLQWPAVQGARSYLIEVARDVGFQEVVLKREVDQPGCSLSGVPPGTYLFHVAAVAEDGVPGPYSPAASLKLRPAAPAPAAPADGTKVGPGQAVTLRWDAVAGADHYEVSVSGAPEGLTPSSPEAVFTPPGPASYTWTVTAVASDGSKSKPSPASSFTVAAPPPPEPPPPPPPPIPTPVYLALAYLPRQIEHRSASGGVDTAISGRVSRSAGARLGFLYRQWIGLEVAGAAERYDQFHLLAQSSRVSPRLVGNWLSLRLDAGREKRLVFVRSDYKTAKPALADTTVLGARLSAFLSVSERLRLGIDAVGGAVRGTGPGTKPGRDLGGGLWVAWALGQELPRWTVTLGAEQLARTVTTGGVWPTSVKETRRTAAVEVELAL